MIATAIMPTRGRSEWAQEAVDCFQLQTWPEKQLIIVDDLDDQSFTGSITSLGPSVIYMGFPVRMTIAAKRNIACLIAADGAIFHWDSDDCSAPGRMADQMQRLSEDAPITGYCSMEFLDQANQRSWLYRSTLPFYAIGSSLAYLKSYWKAHQFTERYWNQTDQKWDYLTLGEDSELVYHPDSQRLLKPVDANGMMVARLHAGRCPENPKDSADIERLIRQGAVEWSEVPYAA